MAIKLTIQTQLTVETQINKKKKYTYPGTVFLSLVPRNRRHRDDGRTDNVFIDAFRNIQIHLVQKNGWIGHFDESELNRMEINIGSKWIDRVGQTKDDVENCSLAR